MNLQISGTMIDIRDDESTSEEVAPEEKGKRQILNGTKAENKESFKVSDQIWKKGMLNDTVLEAAFVDPALSWPPVVKSVSVTVPPSVPVANNNTKQFKKTKAGKKCLFACTKRVNRAVLTETERQKVVASLAAADEETRQEINISKYEQKKEESYNRLPEGILIYRLNTSNHTLTLVSPPSTYTNKKTWIESMIIASAKPSTDKSRRGIDLVGIDGTKTTLIACEQITAIVWYEAIDMMMVNKKGSSAAAASGRKV
jgi:hypothetical protein